MAGPCYYVHFRKTTGDPDFVQGRISGNHMNAVMDYTADEFAPEDATNYGVLETSLADFDAMQTNVASGTYGKHIDDPTGTPTLADGDPS
jgi:hypothetical protein